MRKIRSGIYKSKNILIFCFLLLTTIGYAQHSQYRFSHLNITDGLSNNQVNYILKDSKGFLWFGTLSGLNRFDGYSFKIFKHDTKDSTSLNDNYVYKISEDHKNNLWVYTRSGVNVYHPKTETFTDNPEIIYANFPVKYSHLNNIYKDNDGDFWYSFENGQTFIYDSTKTYRRVDTLLQKENNEENFLIEHIQQDSEGNEWLLAQNGIIYRFNKKANKSTYIEKYIYDKYNGTSQSYVFYLDSDDKIWVHNVLKTIGVYCIDTKTNTVQHFHRKSDKYKLNNDLVTSVVEDNSGNIWIGTDHGGINVFNKKTETIEYVLHNEENHFTISQNAVTSFYKDNTGIIWVATFKQGINFFHENIIKFNTYRHNISNSKSLSFNDVNRFAEDKTGNIWIGTNGGGLDYFDRKNNEFKHFDFNLSSQLGSDVIVGLLLDSQNKLWIGTYQGGLSVFDGKNLKHFRNDPQNPRSIAYNNIWSIFEDSEKNMWIATLGGGLDLYDKKTKTFFHYNAGDMNSVNSNYIIHINEDKKGRIWISTADGVNIYNKKSGRFNYLIHEPNNPNSLSNNNVNTVIFDSKAYVWIGTRDGLNRYDEARNEFKIFNKSEGLPDNVIVSILEEDTNKLWIGTTNGLSNLIISQSEDQENFKFRNYDETEGLQSREFNLNAAIKTSKGELIMGGTNGFNIFDPKNITTNTEKPEVVFTNFEIFNKSVAINEKINGRVILENSITKTKSIKLKYSENMFSISFAALSYFHPYKNQYLYKLEGFNEDWLPADVNTRKATYTNLDPGEYVFMVKASNNDNHWSEESANLIITIKPPLWKTKAAFVLYIFIILFSLLLLRYLVLERERNNFRIQHERQEANRRHELDMLKIRFFTNVSHEFKTPISLIITPLEKLIKQNKNEETNKHYKLMHRNARRLLNLVNQLLDFRRMEVQKIRLNPVLGNIVQFIHDISESFADLAENKDIELKFHTNVKELHILFDQDKIEKIIFNLLSNAYKFTEANGSISININLIDNRDISASIRETAEKWLKIDVIDSGIGIPIEKQEKVFDRFFQNDLPESMINKGTGIGLSLVKEYVKLHGGEIKVESEVNKGSKFSFIMPVQKIFAPNEQIELSEEQKSLISEAQSTENTDENTALPTSKPAILLVEDNEDFRFYLKDNLQKNYQIFEASNGGEGYKIAKSMVPDLIVSDIMMPVMDGIDMCRQVKTNEKTSHIPVILLTAKTSEGQKLIGFDTGADDYITKPFNFEILESRIKNLIKQRKLLLNNSKKYIQLKARDIEITSVEEKFLAKALQIVEDNIPNPNFSVEELSREVGMSRVHLYKKLLALTGKTPIKFIRIIRLQRAVQLLEKSKLSVSEIAYQVGFNNPKYFTRYFKAEYEKLPSVYASEYENKNSTNKENKEEN